MVAEYRYLPKTPASVSQGNNKNNKNPPVMRTEVRLEEHPDKQHTEHKQHHSKSDQRHSSGPDKIQEAQGDPEAELEALQGGPLKIPVYIWTRELVNSCIQWTVGPPLALGLRGTESPRPVCGSLGPSGGPMPLCFGGAMPGLGGYRPSSNHIPAATPTPGPPRYGPILWVSVV